EDERLSLPHGHGDLPERFFTPPWLIHVRELSDMMDFYIINRTAALTSVGLQSFDQLRPSYEGRFDRSLVDQGCLPDVSEGDTPEPCDQRIFALAFDNYGEAFHHRPRGCHRSIFIEPCHLRGRGVVLSRQCPEERIPHVPPEAPQPSHVMGKHVVLHDPSVFRPVPVYDVEIAIVNKFGAVGGLPVPHI